MYIYVYIYIYIELTKNSIHIKEENRGRNIIWDNPSFSKNVKTNIGKKSLHLFDRHFGRNHKYHKIFNHNNVKLVIAAWII